MAEDWLLAIEAKMFHNPSPAALNNQMRKQRVLLNAWAEHFQLSTDSGPEYSVGVLRDAVKRHGDLQSVSKSSVATGFMTGAEILEAHADRTLDIFTVGRQGGVSGRGFTEDLMTGGWRSHRYEVGTLDVPGNANWFTVG